MLDAVGQAVVSGLSVGGIYALIGLTFSITFKTTKTLNFAQGEVISLGAFVGFSVLLLGTMMFGGEGASGSRIDWWLYAVAALSSGIFVALVGIVVFVFAVKPFAGKGGMNWVVSTIGFGIVLQSIGLAIWGPASISFPGFLDSASIRMGTVGVRPQELLVLGCSILLMLTLDYALYRTRIGNALMAVAYSPQVASLMGINVVAVMSAAYALSSALAAIGGVLIAPLVAPSLFMGFALALKGFSGAILGGLTSPRGCIFGGFLLGLLEAGVGLWDAQWREVAVFSVIIIVLILRPAGLFGSVFHEKV